MPNPTAAGCSLLASLSMTVVVLTGSAALAAVAATEAGGASLTLPCCCCCGCCLLVNRPGLHLLQCSDSEQQRHLMQHCGGDPQLSLCQSQRAHLCPRPSRAAVRAAPRAGARARARGARLRQPAHRAHRRAARVFVVVVGDCRVVGGPESRLAHARCDTAEENEKQISKSPQAVG